MIYVRDKLRSCQGPGDGGLATRQTTSMIAHYIKKKISK